VIGLVDNETSNGTKDKNPFNFQHFNLVENSVYCDGQQRYGMKLPTRLFKDEGNTIDRAAFGSGYALYAFDLTPDLGEDDHFSLTRQGRVWC